MCTLIVGRDILAPGSVVMAANRDEDPGRPSDPPGILSSMPRLAGGRDRAAGGTWLAVGQGRAVAMLNRRPQGAPPAAERSRGLLALDVARDTNPAEAIERELARVRYAAFSLAVLEPARARLWCWDGTRAVVREIPPGWHVVTHADLDDPDEPRTAALLGGITGWLPGTWREAEAGLRARLAEHDPPAVCLHDGRMQTVSWSFVLLDPVTTRYSHGAGRPCECAAEDQDALLRMPE